MKTILLIEDNTEMRENIAEILELGKYKVITAQNGKEGVKYAQEGSPDLIICDIMMPELDGYGVIHLLNMDPRTANIPFIFLTAKSEKTDMRKGMNMGADDYLTKPFDDMELLNAVEMRLKKNERLRKNYENNAESFTLFLDEASTIKNIGELSKNRKVKNFKKKETVYSEDSNPTGVYLLAKGKVKAIKSNELGKEFITELYKEGDFIGYADLLEGRKHSDTTIALEDSELIFISKDDFFQLIFKDRDVAARFIKMLSNNISEKEARLLKLAYNSVRKRVSEGLLMLKDKYTKGEDKNFSMAISREDLASIVGTATETVIRTLSDFKEEKIINIKGSTIELVNEEKLRNMKN